MRIRKKGGREGERGKERKGEEGRGREREREWEGGGERQRERRQQRTLTICQESDVYLLKLYSYTLT